MFRYAMLYCYTLWWWCTVNTVKHAAAKVLETFPLFFTSETLVVHSSWTIQQRQFKFLHGISASSENDFSQMFLRVDQIENNFPSNENPLHVFCMEIST